MGVMFIVGACYFVKHFRRWAFYILIISVIVPVISFPIDDRPAMLILIEFITKDLQRVIRLIETH